MKNAFIIHGAFGDHNSNWTPWLKDELEKLGYEVVVPLFPTPEDQSLSSWLEVFAKYVDKLNSDSILIGHSIGATFILSLLDMIDDPVRRVYLVSGFISDLGIEKFDSINHTFYNKSFDWEKINKNNFHVFHGDNDPYVPFEKAAELAEKLCTNLIKIKNGGHLNEAAGFSTFDLLLEDIKQGLTNN